MTPSSKSAAEGGGANADAAPVKRYSLFTAIRQIAVNSE